MRQPDVKWAAVKIGAGAWTMGRQLRKVVYCPDRWLKAVVGRIAENQGKGEHT